MSNSQWQAISPEKLMADFLPDILAYPLQNNRLLGALIQFQRQPSPLLHGLLYYNERSQLEQIVVYSGHELWLVYHPQFLITAKFLSALQQKISFTFTIVCHEQQIEQWQLAADSCQYKEIPLMRMILYQLKPQNLVTERRHSGLVFKRIEELKPRVIRFIRAFIEETMGMPIKNYEIQKRFNSFEFYGLFEQNQLLSIAAATRWAWQARAISYVYTPKSLRRKGYSRLCVTALCQELFQNQKEITAILLYADSKNQASQSLYETIGFNKICVASTF